MQKGILISEKPGIRNNVFKCNGEDDIPFFLSNIVKIIDNKVVCLTIEGKKERQLGVIISYEFNNGEYTAWPKDDANTTLFIKDGKYYEKAHPVKAYFLDEEIPQELFERGLKIDEHGKYYFIKNNESTWAKDNKSLFMIYDETEDEIVDANFLDRDSVTYDGYYLYESNIKLSEYVDNNKN